MLTPLVLMAVGFVAYFLALLILRVRAEIAGRKVQALMMAGAMVGAGEIHDD
jgi:heme exporter protein C